MQTTQSPKRVSLSELVFLASISSHRLATSLTEEEALAGHLKASRNAEGIPLFPALELMQVSGKEVVTAIREFMTELYCECLVRISTCSN